MGTDRLETFADGVFAIAATLLILSVDAHVGDDRKGLAHALLHAWPFYVAYVVSFLTMGIIWVNHHVVMAQIGTADRTFLMITVGFLMVVAFIPFPTRLVAQHIRDDGALAATLVYGITLTLTAVMFNVLWHYAIHDDRLLADDADPATVRGITRSYAIGPWVYLAATLVAFVSPVVSAVLFGVLALFYVLESSIFGREGAAADEN
jgi:uncharacterized membrane protein